MTPAEIGIRFRELRKLAGLTQAQLAERVGLNVSTITQFELGKQNIAIETLYRLSDAIQAEIVIQTKL